MESRSSSTKPYDCSMAPSLGLAGKRWTEAGGEAASHVPCYSRRMAFHDFCLTGEDRQDLHWLGDRSNLGFGTACSCTSGVVNGSGKTRCFGRGTGGRPCSFVNGARAIEAPVVDVVNEYSSLVSCPPERFAEQRYSCTLAVSQMRSLSLRVCSKSHHAPT